MAPVIEFFNVYSLLACVIALLWYYSRSTFNYWRKLNVPFLKPVPFFGNTAAFVLRRKPTHENFDQLYRALHDQPYGGIYEMRNPALLVKDPRVVTNILVRDFNYFHDRNLLFRFSADRKLNPLFRQHLPVAEGDRWKILRQRFRPFFSARQLRQMRLHEQIARCIAATSERIDTEMDGTGSADVNASQIASRLVVDVLFSFTFGIEYDSVEAKDKLAEMSDQVLKPTFVSSIRFIASSLSQRLVTLLKLPNIKKTTSDFFLELTLDTVEYRRQNGLVKKDLLQSLMSLQNSYEDPKFSVHDNVNVLENEKFDEMDIVAHMFMVFLAGYEAVVSTLSFCLYELALSSDHIQQRLRFEVLQVLDKYETLSQDSLKEMVYMDAVIAETLRKYPAIVTLNRKCTEEYVIPESQVRIPVGTKVLIPIWSIHHDSRFYQNPEIFDPERFLHSNKQAQASGIYMPFGNGPRMCTSKQFVELELKAILAEIILKYEIKPCVKTEIPLRFREGGVTLVPKRDIWINLSKRCSGQ